MNVFTVGLGLWLFVVAVSVALALLEPTLPAAIDRAPPRLYWVLVLTAVVVGAAPLVPSGFSGDQQTAAFSVDRARDHIGVVAVEPRPMGSESIDEVRQYIAAELRQLGLQPEMQPVSAPDYYDGSSATVAVVNVAARIEGTASTGAVALVAHFDTVPWTPGANDNASGVAVVLETARVLLADGPIRNDVILIFTDGEEPAPRYGSTAFVADHPWADEIRFVINLEAIGTSGPSLMTEVTGPHRWILDRYATAAPHPAAFSFLTETTELLGGSNTDFAPFRDSGVAGVEFAYARGSSIYHTDADTPDRVSSRALQAHGANTLGLTRDLAAADLSAASGDDDMVFFTIGRDQVIRYPASWPLVIVGTTGIVLLTVLWGRRSWLAVAGGATMSLIVAATIAIVGAGLWMLLAGWRSRMGVGESYAYLAGFAAIGAAVMASPALSRPGMGRETRAEDIVMVWWLLGLLTAVVAPGSSYLFTWPALAGTLALAVGLDSENGAWRQLVPAAVTMLVTAVLLVPAIDTSYQLAQPRPGNPDSEILATIAIPMVLFALSFQLALAIRVVNGPGSGADNEHAPAPMPTKAEAKAKAKAPVTATATATAMGRGVASPQPADGSPSSPTLPPAGPGRHQPGRHQSPADRQPWDPANGLRVGIVAGGLIGAGLVAVSGISSFSIVVACGAVGGGLGFWSEKRKQQGPPTTARR